MPSKLIGVAALSFEHQLIEIEATVDRTRQSTSLEGLGPALNAMC